MPKAKESITKALALNDTLAEAHASLAHVLMSTIGTGRPAKYEFKRSLELKPDYARACVSCCLVAVHSRTVRNPVSHEEEWKKR